MERHDWKINKNPFEDFKAAKTCGSNENLSKEIHQNKKKHFRKYQKVNKFNKSK